MVTLDDGDDESKGSGQVLWWQCPHASGASLLSQRITTLFWQYDHTDRSVWHCSIGASQIDRPCHFIRFTSR